MYYVILDETKNIGCISKSRLNKIEPHIRQTKKPFSTDYIDIYTLSSDLQECKKYLDQIDPKIKHLFKIVKFRSELKYTAFIDILGFSDYIKRKIVDDFEADDFYTELNEIIKYLQYEQTMNIEIEYVKDSKLNFVWISDTFVVTIEYIKGIESKKLYEIQTMLLFRLSIIISSIHHYCAIKFDLLVRGAISSKYSCIQNNLIVGEGISEANFLEKNIAIFPRVIFEESLINEEIVSLQKDRPFISKDCDGYYFVDYLNMLRYMPPMIGNTRKVEHKYVQNVACKEICKLIDKYKKLVLKGLSEKNQKVKQKYMWLDNYLRKIYA